MLLYKVMVFLFLSITRSSSRLLCGVELITSNFMEIYVKLDCPNHLTEHRKCCTDHGVCYLFREHWKVCDKRYCECVHKIAGKSGGICQTHGENFCKIVTDTGVAFIRIMESDDFFCD